MEQEIPPHIARCFRKAKSGMVVSGISAVASISIRSYTTSMPVGMRKPITLPRSEQKQIEHLDRIMRVGAPALMTGSGEKIEMPTTVYQLLRKVVGYMALGQAVTLLPDKQVVTTQRAADILGVSRPFFIKLLESGVMAHHRVGNQRRVYLRDVLEFAKKRDEQRRVALDRLARDAHESGLYERNVMPEGGSDE
jgi:excisionase family DNA binding protein